MMIDIDMDREFVVYEFRHKVTGIYYRGKTSMTSWQSGKYETSSEEFKNILREQGKKNFHQIILATFDDEEEAYDYEDFIVKPKTQDNLSYNKHTGGSGFRSKENHPRFGLPNPSNTNTIWIHNPHSDESIRIKEGDEIPSGFQYGRPDFDGESKEKYSTAKSETRWYTNPKTNENKRITDGDEIPNGFVLGCHKPAVKKYKWYFNLDNGRKKRFLVDDDNIPSNYVKGTRSPDERIYQRRADP